MEIKRQIPFMDLEQIAASGQCFRMEEKADGWYVLIAGERYLMLRQEGKSVGGSRFTFLCSEEEFQGFWKLYFDLERDYGGLRDRIDAKDLYLKQAAEFGWGIRILKQDLWEMIVTFIISQQNNIPRIRRCIRLLCERYGEKKKSVQGEIYHAFPTPAVLAGASLEELSACNLGYRAKYLNQTAHRIAEGDFLLQALTSMSYEEAKRELMKLYGVGIKVAECVCLFALQHVDAFPVDTHIRQILQAHYPQGFPFLRYQGIAGILQQLMFYYELHGDKSG